MVKVKRSNFLPFLIFTMLAASILLSLGVASIRERTITTLPTRQGYELRRFTKVIAAAATSSFLAFMAWTIWTVTYRYPTFFKFAVGEILGFTSTVLLAANLILMSWELHTKMHRNIWMAFTILTAVALLHSLAAVILFPGFYSRKTNRPIVKERLHVGGATARDYGISA